MQAAAAGLEGRKPNRLQNRQQRRWLIRPGPTQHDVQSWWHRLERLGSERADGGFAVVTQQFDGLVQQFPFVLRSGGAIPSPQSDQYLFLGLFAHIVVHVG